MRRAPALFQLPHRGGATDCGTIDAALPGICPSHAAFSLEDATTPHSLPTDLSGAITTIVSNGA